MIVKLLIVMTVLIVIRFLQKDKQFGKAERNIIETGTANFIGNREIQADAAEFSETSTGLLAVLADGIGKDKLGRIASGIAIESIISLYSSYEYINHLSYFFKRAFYVANYEILKVMEGRRGGASVAAVLVNNGKMMYALAGNIKIAVFRRGELIPISEGQTINVLAGKAYKKGVMNKQKALWAMEEKRVWNYVGQDGFKGIETLDTPVQLKTGDRILLMTKGVYEGILWKDIENTLKYCQEDPKAMAYKIIDQLNGEDIDNSSVSIITYI